MSQFLNIEQQIEKLENQKGLIISDKNYARKVLSEIGYFSLVTWYKTPFKDANNNYRKGTKLEDLVALFKFDENLRDIVLKYILRIEQHLRTLTAYYFCTKYGENQKFYLNIDTFVYNLANKWQVKKLVRSLNILVNVKKGCKYITAEREKAGNVPLWIAINAVPIGSLTRLYSFLAPDIKTKISSHFSDVNPNDLEQYLLLLTDFRNVCAHCECLYNHKSKRQISFKNFADNNKRTHNDLWAIAVVFSRLLSHDDFCKFYNGMKNILNSYSEKSGALSKDELCGFMGFPENYSFIAEQFLREHVNAE